MYHSIGNGKLGYKCWNNFKQFLISSMINRFIGLLNMLFKLNQIKFGVTRYLKKIPLYLSSISCFDWEHFSSAKKFPPLHSQTTTEHTSTRTPCSTRENFNLSLNKSIFKICDILQKTNISSPSWFGKLHFYIVYCS